MMVSGKEAEKLLRELGLSEEKDSKYHSKKIVVDGITFDSEREARRYGELMALRLAGEIRDLELQKSFELIPVQRDGAGRVIERAVRYKADFYYYDNRRRCYVVEDTKGVRPPPVEEKGSKKEWQPSQSGGEPDKPLRCGNGNRE